MPHTQPTLLATKLFVPRPQGGLVERSRLLEQLDQIPQRRLALVSAPAGFGKTTLVSEWLHQSGMPAAWVSLETAENDPHRFLTYLIAALRGLFPDVGTSAREALAMSTVPPMSSLLPSLINDISSLESDFVVVLDDYHRIENTEVHELIGYLLEHMPPVMHVVLTTRVDPPIQLPRLRVHGQLLEVRAADLRFSVEESARFFHSLASLDLNEKQLEAVQSRTEGWVAGLQMAGLSLQGRKGDDVEGFIQAFTGADRYVIDYLLEEVLERQPEELQQAMLDLSLLERFNAALLEAITGRDDGQELLEELERRNMFMIPLDNHRGWYRYHHLFADLLQHRLRSERTGEQVADLHRIASAWFEGEGEYIPAVEHARDAGDPDLIVRLLDGHWRELQREVGHTEWFAALLREIPEQVRRTNPRLGVTEVWINWPPADVAATEARLDEIEQLIEQQTDRDDYRDMITQVYLARTGLARDHDQPELAIRYAERALELHPGHPPDSPYYQPSTSRGIVYALLGTGYDQLGDYARGEAATRRLLEYAREADDLYSMTNALAHLTYSNLAHGRLGEVLRLAEELWKLRDTAAFLQPGLPAKTPQMRGVVALERYELDQALEQSLLALDMTDAYPMLQRIDVMRLLLQIYEARNEPEEANSILSRLESFVVGRPVRQRIHSVVMMARARLEIAHGSLDVAHRWVREFYEGPGASNPASVERRDIARQSYFQSRIEALFYAWVLINDDRSGEAVTILSTLAEEFAAKDLIRLLLDARTYLAVALERTGEHQQAVDTTIATLAQAAPEGFIHPFARCASMLAPVLRDALRSDDARIAHLAPEYLQKLTSATGLGMPAEMPAAVSAGGVLTAGPATAVDGMVLTTREFEILELLARGYSNRKIAEKLYVSINTVKTHMSNLFDKLDAHNRVDALVRAREAKLLE